jgi:hypothetical protein
MAIAAFSFLAKHREELQAAGESQRFRFPLGLDRSDHAAC